MKKLLLLISLVATFAHAADLPPDKGNVIPASGQRPVVVELQAGAAKAGLPKADLPAGYTLGLAAGAPLVTHPIAGCLDDRGRLFLGDAVGVNWYKAQLEKEPPNRVLMLEDKDGDGVFDKSTIFADKMTFPQGAQWLSGSLYVMSPPSLWKLTDTNDDGVADQREELVTGFDYTGNAADVHGPFLHPTNGRLYWCHGRKGYKVPDKGGTIVHEGKSSGIWSCKPDGSDVQWHALLAGDNPVEVDFTPDGDVIGVQNLYFSQPRGDTLMHWLYGGVYSRVDQMKVIEGLPSTLEHMPVMHNFGHVAVSGCCFWKRWSVDAPVRNQTEGGEAAKNVSTAPLQFMVTHFNTQRVVRMELTPEGSTYKAVENEFLKVHNPDIHFTDVMEDPRDGSLLVIDTGGWFRIGCPSSLMAKADVMGAVYRVKASAPAVVAKPWTVAPQTGTLAARIAELKSTDSFKRRLAMEWIDMNVKEDHENAAENTAISEALLDMMGERLDAVTLHHLISLSKKFYTVSYQDLKDVTDKLTLKHMLLCFMPDDGATINLTAGIASQHLDSEDQELAAVALTMVTEHSDADEWFTEGPSAWLKEKSTTPQRLHALTVFCGRLIGQPHTNALLAQMLGHEIPLVRDAALEVLTAHGSPTVAKEWVAALDALLPDSTDKKPAGSEEVRLPVLLDAIKRLKMKEFDAKLQAIVDDISRPPYIRLKALDAMVTLTITRQAFTLVYGVLTQPESSAAAKIQAAVMLGRAKSLTKEESLILAQAFATVGPVELKELLGAIRASKREEVVRAMTTELAKNPSLVSLQESLYRSALADKPTDIFETVILPAYHKGTETIEAKKRLLGPLSDKAVARGDATSGRGVFESGKGTCIACHKLGDIGRPIGPDLSKIGAIRTERDLIESILFPSNTLSRDYEAHIIETSGGEAITGVIRSHTAEGLLVVDVAGQEKNVPHQTITGDTTLTTSLMPMGLDTTLPEQELLDLVAYLRSLK